MILDNNAVVVSYPNQAGDPGRYDLRDQRSYFEQFDGGASRVFQLALENTIHGDLLEFHETCNEYFDSQFSTVCNETFDNQYGLCLEDNSLTLAQYHIAKKEFNRRIFDVYRFAKTSLARLGENPGFSTVRRIATNRTFDSGSFLLK